MSIAISGSIATDHLMHFPGRFADHWLAESLEAMSLSFLVDGLVIHRGGVGANIAFGLGVLGRRPLLVGAVGKDFGEYRAWLEEHGVDCSDVLVVESAHTGRFTCTTDDDQCQLASFYPGAMEESKNIPFGDILEQHSVGLVLIGASEPASMIMQTVEARTLGVPFAADPSQQLPRLDGEQCRSLVDGAAYLFTNEYEWELLRNKTGWSEEEITSRVGLRITTLSSAGVQIADSDGLNLHVDVVPARQLNDPTGVGDGFRSGFLSGVEAGLDVQRSAQLGALIATLVIETEGAQEWRLDIEDALARVASSYGVLAASEIEPVLLGRSADR
jgi:adenosine kinase